MQWEFASLRHIIASSMGGSKASVDKFLLDFDSPIKPTNPDSSKAKWLMALGIKE